MEINELTKTEQNMMWVAFEEMILLHKKNRSLVWIMGIHDNQSFLREYLEILKKTCKLSKKDIDYFNYGIK